MHPTTMKQKQELGFYFTPPEVLVLPPRPQAPPTTSPPTSRGDVLRWQVEEMAAGNFAWRGGLQQL